MSYCIKGDYNRGKEVIKLLESKGGINKFDFRGNIPDYFYYLDKDNNIRRNSSKEITKEVILQFCEELTLPEEFKFKIGEYARCNMPHTGQHRLVVQIDDITDDRLYHLIPVTKGLILVDKDVREEYLEPWKPQRSEPVLVRDYPNCSWREAYFSFYDEKSPAPYYTIGGNNWNYCIPFDITKLGKVTD